MLVLIRGELVIRGVIDDEALANRVSEGNAVFVLGDMEGDPVIEILPEEETEPRGLTDIVSNIDGVVCTAVIRI